MLRCSGCGVEVHESCCGVADFEDPEQGQWVCDPCKAGVQNPVCIACPIEGGLLKQVEIDGRWIHLLCGMYIEPCYWGDDQSLSPVVIGKIPASSWDSKVCLLCKTSEDSSSGMCLKCDAGLCRKYFHATCAQKHGLLQEEGDDDSEAPFYAHCPQHVDKNTAKQKQKAHAVTLRRWRILNRLAQEKKRTPASLKSLQGLRAAYHSERKAWCAGNRDEVEEGHAVIREIEKLRKDALNASKASLDTFASPALTVEFVEQHDSYWTQLSQLDASCMAGKNKNESLEMQSTKLRLELETLQETTTQQQTGLAQISAKCAHMRELLSTLLCAEVPSPPGLVDAPKSAHSNDKGATHRHELNEVLATCHVCDKSNDQSSIVRCDTCKEHYHIHCHDPPLRTVPKKSKYKLWQCSECDETTDSEGTLQAKAVVTGKRRISRTTKYEDYSLLASKKHKGKRKKHKGGAALTKKRPDD